MAKKLLGKVCATRNDPTNTTEFKFWMAEHAEDLQIGDIVVAEEGNEKIYGLVSQMQYYTDAESAFAEFFSHDFGQPQTIPPTERTSVEVVTAEVIGSNSQRIRPARGGIVRFANPSEIRQAYNMDQIDDPVVCGIVRNGPDPTNVANAVLSEKFLLGPEGAHINISGASGLATKTSAAIFLVQSLLSRAKQEKRKVAVIAFNLKSEDLLFLERNKNEAQDIIDLLPLDKRQLYKLIKTAGVNLTFDEGQLRYFAPAMKYDLKRPDSLRQEKKMEIFYWTYGNVVDPGCPVKLHNLIDPEDLDDRTYGVLTTLEDHSEKESLKSFKDVINYLESALSSVSRTGYWYGHHGATVAKVLRLLRVTTQERLRGLFSYDSPHGRDLPIDQIKSGDLWVIDIQALNDKGKRIVFFNVIDRLARILEEQKGKPQQQRRFDSIMVFVDELNKFAPSHAGDSPIKHRIVDIASRGRSIGLVLIGAQQFASRVEREVYGNTATQLVGRSEVAELRDSTYAWISRDLQYLVASLPKGKLLLRHSLFTRPIVIEFPRPIFTYTESDIDRLLSEAAAREEKTEELQRKKGEKVFDSFVQLVKSQKLTGDKIYNECQNLRRLGIGRQAYGQWFEHWYSKKSYEKGHSAETSALNITLHFLKKNVNRRK